MFKEMPIIECDNGYSIQKIQNGGKQFSPDYEIVGVKNSPWKDSLDVLNLVLEKTYLLFHRKNLISAKYAIQK